MGDYIGPLSGKPGVQNAKCLISGGSFIALDKNRWMNANLKKNLEIKDVADNLQPIPQKVHSQL